MSKQNVFQNATKRAELSRVEALKVQKPEIFEEKLVGFSTRLPESMVRELKILAATRNTTVQELVAGTFEALLADSKQK